VGGEISQGKPWANLSCPRRATDWKRPNYRAPAGLERAARETARRETYRGVTSYGRKTREAPVRAEPHPASPIVLVLVLVLVLIFDRRRLKAGHGGDVMWQEDPASPGSGGASPYLPNRARSRAFFGRYERGVQRSLCVLRRHALTPTRRYVSAAPLLPRNPSAEWCD
jgi:hypothetical protein